MERADEGGNVVSSAPNLDVSQSSSLVRARSGNTIVIGGLIQDIESDTDRGIIGLKNVPGIGVLFKGTYNSSKKRELVMFVTPRLVGTSESSAPGGRITMKLKACLFALGLSSSAVALAEEPASVSEIETARNAIHNGEYDAAISHLEHMEAASENWEQHFWLGTAFLLDGQLENATNALDTALGIEGEIASIWVQRAVVEQEQGRYPVALQFLEIASDVDSDYAMTYLNAGQVYESLGNWDDARGAYGQLLKLSMRETGSARMMRLRREILQRIAATGNPSS